MTENEISYKIIGAAIEVHKNLGVGLLENAYETALVYELQKLGFDVKQQYSLPLNYKDIEHNKFLTLFIIKCINNNWLILNFGKPNQATDITII